MSRESLLVGLGVVVLLSPFSGLPLSWLSFLLPVCGVLVVIIGITLNRRKHAIISDSHEASPTQDRS